MNILIIADSHIPFEHRKYLDFCCRQRDKYKCSKVVHIGDLVDNHACSYWEHNPNGYSPKHEHDKALKKLKVWYKEFPRVLLCKGNHDILIDRQAISKGLPEIYIRTFEEIWELPKGWIYDWKHFIHGVCFEHGTGYSGLYPHAQILKTNRCSTVIGHIHSVAGIYFSANDTDLIFGLAVGGGFDRKKYPFWYSRDFRNKPILGCGIIEDSGRKPRFEPMKL